MIIECKNCNTKFNVNESDIGANGRMVSCSVCEYEWLYIPPSPDNNESIIQPATLKDIINNAGFNRLQTPKQSDFTTKFPSEVEAVEEVGKKELKVHEELNTDSLGQLPTDIDLCRKSNQPEEKPYYFTMLVSIMMAVGLLAGFLYVEREFLIRQHPIIETIYKPFDYHNTDGLNLSVGQFSKIGEPNTINKEGRVQYLIPVKIINNTDKARFLQTIKVLGYTTAGNKIINLSTNISKEIAPNSELDITFKTNYLETELNLVIVKMGNLNDLRDLKYEDFIRIQSKPEKSS
ncbi:zinc-ribbon domain-containing protein [Candidatus Bandiella euplotis]|uniref:Zinc-finger domain protein n=1 Tax=Candidatus Bandiella euplotis TaxID=1664265 RepID=A0ABZ0UJY0_9RICK|nr:zinc-ribbon domain-containing protein [Candidatus Bandiella woodruffii]WPX95962.1 Putative zinc-finger domain protein [Candidatus Bandiella woodruffii]